MCGLAGVAGDLSNEDVIAFKELLVLNILRGMDSTGVAAINVKRDIQVFKKAMAVPDFLTYSRANNIANSTQQILIGHTRAATIGKILQRTAHPFEIGDIVGAHNGTLTQWYKMKDSKEFDVDSECLIHNIERYGWEDTFKHLSGAWAVTVYDKRDHTLKIVRNNERPLHIVEREDGKVMYWASEEWMLKAISSRRNIKLKKKIWQPKENVLFTWQFPEDKYNMKVPTPTSVKLEVEPEKKYEYSPYQHYGGQSGYQRTTPHTSHTYKGQKRGSVSSIKSGRTGPEDCTRVGRPLVGDVVHICPIEKKRSKLTHQNYVECCMTTEPYCTVRLYGDEDFLALVLKDGACGDVKLTYDSSTNAYSESEFFSAHARSFRQDLPDGPAGFLDEEEDEVLIVGPGNKLIDLKEWEQRTKHGCAVCTADLFEDDDITWKGESPICENCSDIATKL